MMCLYLAIGCIVLSKSLLDNCRKQVEPSAAKLLASMGEPQGSTDQLLQTVVVPVVAGVLMVVGWPVALAVVWRNQWQLRHQVNQQGETVFRIRTHHLVRETSVQEVERLETVVDPMGAVPALPFGHLHHVWQDFVVKRPADARLWVFSCDWESDLGCRFRREGYVWVVADQPVYWMLMRDELLEDDDDGRRTVA